jgi:hypothetical protein
MKNIMSKRKLIYIIPTAVFILIVGVSLLLANSGHFKILANALHMSANDMLPSDSCYVVNATNGSGQPALPYSGPYNYDPASNKYLSKDTNKNIVSIMWQSGANWYIASPKTPNSTTPATYVYSYAGGDPIQVPPQGGPWTINPVNPVITSIPVVTVGSGSACGQTTTSTSKIIGTVVDSLTNKPISNASVVFQQTSASYTPAPPFPKITTDPKGQFIFDLANTGTLNGNNLTFSVSATNYNNNYNGKPEPITDYGISGPLLSNNATYTFDQPIKLDFVPKNFNIGGTVVNKLTNQPVSPSLGMQFEFNDATKTHGETLLADGTFLSKAWVSTSKTTEAEILAITVNLKGLAGYNDINNEKIADFSPTWTTTSGIITLNLTIKLTPTNANNNASIGGTVISSSDSKGISGITLALDGPTKPSAQTNDSGVYNFSNLPAGTYSLTITVPQGYSLVSNSANPTINNIKLNNNTYQNEGFTLSKNTNSGGSITAKATAANGSPSSGDQISITGNGIDPNAQITQCMTQLNGACTITNLRDGSYNVAAKFTSNSTEEITPSSQTVVVANGGNAIADFKLTSIIKTGEITGQVTCAGNPISGVAIKLDSNQPYTTQANGSYTFNNLTSGVHNLTSADPRYTISIPTQESVNVNVISGKTTTINIGLSVAESLSGKVIANGTGVGNIQVLINTKPIPTSVTTVSDGSYAFGPLPSWTYTITVNSKTNNPHYNSAYSSVSEQMYIGAGHAYTSNIMITKGSSNGPVYAAALTVAKAFVAAANYLAKLF